MEKNKSIREIINTIIGETLALPHSPSNKKEEKEALYSIISNSQKAILFISQIEERFEMELDDDDIDINFFSDVDQIEKILIHNNSN